MADDRGTSPRIVSFDLMPREPDYYFVLTEALRDFASRQRAEAADIEDADDFGTRLRLAETAEAALDQLEEAMNTPATDRRVRSRRDQGASGVAARRPGFPAAAQGLDRGRLRDPQAARRRARSLMDELI